MSLRESDLIYDWNQVGEIKPARGRIEVLDETLRDGLQSPSVKSPTLDEKLQMLHCMVELGIDAVNLGLPGAGAHVVADVERLAREIADQNLPITPNCAARTVEGDIEHIADISQRTGIAIEAACFVGSSPIRHFAESWDLDHVLSLAERAVSFAVGSGLPAMFVTEDTTRAQPDDLRRLYRTAIDAGASRVCIADTVGHATPNGARRVVRFVREVVGEDIGIDWHGHRDRGMAVICALAAAEAGVDRLHGTALGIGERVGNTPLDLLLVNLSLLDWREQDLRTLPAYCELVARTTGATLPDNYPVIGKDAFRTGTGVHAAAIVKARAKGDDWLADRIYSSVPASLIGRRQVIEIGPMSGRSNVVWWLEQRGREADPDLVEAIFERAKRSKSTLEEREIEDEVARFEVGR
ncbi:MAG: 2-isopropylmalate synthase [Myxococcales bacterium]|nr:2-isopropylmalate synthase [Myxococcales bacterium]